MVIYFAVYVFIIKMRAVGFEPTRTLVQRILSPLRLPLRHARKTSHIYKSGFEPEISILKIDALPFGYSRDDRVKLLLVT